MELLGVDPRTIEVLLRLPNNGLFQWSPVLLRCSPPCSLSFLEVGLGPLPDSLTSSFILACIRCPSSTCRVNLYKNWHLSHQSNPGIVEDGLIKLKSTTLSGTAHWMAMRAAFPDILRFSFKFGPIPGLPFFFWWGFGSAEDWVVLGCTTKLFGALHCRAWAVVLLGSGLWTL